MVLLPGCKCCGAGPCCCSATFNPYQPFSLTTELNPGQSCSGTLVAKPASCDFDAVTITIALCGETLTKTAAQWANSYSNSRFFPSGRTCSFSGGSFVYCSQYWSVDTFDQQALLCRCNYRIIRLRIMVTQNNSGCVPYNPTIRTQTCIYNLTASECHNALSIFPSFYDGSSNFQQSCCESQCPISATINWAP